MINCSSDFDQTADYGNIQTPTYKRDFIVKGNPGHVDREVIKGAFLENTQEMGVVDVINSQMHTS